jgi:hypothetical protein
VHGRVCGVATLPTAQHTGALFHDIRADPLVRTGHKVLRCDSECCHMWRCVAARAWRIISDGSRLSCLVVVLLIFRRAAWHCQRCAPFLNACCQTRAACHNSFSRAAHLAHACLWLHAITRRARGHGCLWLPALASRTSARCWPHVACRCLWLFPLLAACEARQGGGARLVTLLWLCSRSLLPPRCPTTHPRIAMPPSWSHARTHAQAMFTRPAHRQPCPSMHDAGTRALHTLSWPAEVQLMM